MSDEYLAVAAAARGAQEEEHTRRRQEKQGDHTRMVRELEQDGGDGAVFPVAGPDRDEVQEAGREEHEDSGQELIDQDIGSRAGGAAALQCPHSPPHQRRRDGRCTGSQLADLLFEIHGRA